MNTSLKFANQQGYTDVRPYEVIKVISDKCIEVRTMDSVETEESREARIKSFQPGGFFGHTDNSVQRYTFASNESYPIKRIRLGKSGQWKDAHGNKYKLSDEPVKFYDWNF